jgi:hypothetical protein
MRWAGHVARMGEDRGVLFLCEEINAQRELLKQQMGTWPASKEDLITKYKKEFFVFIESTDFDNLKL